MKISKRKLKRIIKEELTKALTESAQRCKAISNAARDRLELQNNRWYQINCVAAPQPVAPSNRDSYSGKQLFGKGARCGHCTYSVVRYRARRRDGREVFVDVYDSKTRVRTKIEDPNKVKKIQQIMQRKGG